MAGFSKRANKGNQEAVAPVHKKEFNKSFNPTEEQEESHQMSYNSTILKIGASAGSGKTALLAYIADQHKKETLVLVYNKSAATDAEGRFPSNCTVKTTHSLAYGVFGRMYQHKLTRPTKYRNVAGNGLEVANYFSIPDWYLSVPNQIYINKSYLGLIIRDTVNSYETSADTVLSKKHIPFRHIKDITDRYGEDFKKLRDKFTAFILRYAEDLWDARTDTLSPVLAMHDTYLKLYQLSKPDLSKYPIIMLDESQDSPPVTLDIVMRQKTNSQIILVGDKYQEIYGWRGAVNAMETVISDQEGWLSQSWRYGQEIAEVAQKVLGNKVVLKGRPDFKSLVGDRDVISDQEPYTIVYRTNMSLLLDAVDLLSNGESINLDVDVRDFIKMLQSVEALHEGNVRKVKHEEIIPFSSWEDFTVEAEQGGQLKRVMSIVLAGETGKIINTLLKHRGGSSSRVSLITCHRFKGGEADNVLIANDFPDVYDSKGNYTPLSQPEENLLYVAVTRAKNKLQYNTTVRHILERY